DFFKRLYERKARQPDALTRTLYEKAVKARILPAAIAARKSLTEQFAKSEEEFDRLFASYHVSLGLSEKQQDWNEGMAELAKAAGIAASRIVAAKHDFMEAVFQRIEIRW